MRYTPFTPQTKGEFMLQNLFPHSPFYLYPYARFALFELLKYLKIKSIYIPYLICRDILAPIHILDLQYHFYEIDQHFNPIGLDKHCDAILFVNYFGFASDIAPFLDYCHKTKSLLIEDNAHGFLSKDNDGKWLGTRGDFGLFSLRKTFSLQNGGLLSINNPTFHNLNLSSYPFQPSSTKNPISKKEKLKALSPFLAYQTMRFRQFIRYIKTGNPLPHEDPQTETILPSDNFVTPQLSENMLQFDIQAEITKRREMYKEIQKIAKNFNIPSLQNLYEGCSPFVFPFLQNSKSRDFEKYISKFLFYTLPWPSLPKQSLCKLSWYQQIKVVPFLW